MIYPIWLTLPDIAGAVIPAGETGILASFIYRLAFDNAGQQFGLARAITLLIFLVVAAISYANFAAIRRAANGFMLLFLALTLFPFLTALLISFPEGNLSFGSLIPH